ncbi:MAG: ArsR family transcriptional regulator, partial [Pseudomonadota bacterium]|nr:ArsR family transcriptional regulator [Pseudomonadota bacterium]
MNMVLHHLPSPAASLETAGQLLNANGRLLLIDLCPHHQDWARATCGDLWLGFEPQDLDNWTANAKLRRGQSAFLGLRNGFQLQLRLFNKA